MDVPDKLLRKYAKTLLAFTKWEKDGVSKCTVDLSQIVGPTQARWLRELGLSRPFAVITAWNPGGIITSEKVNDAAHELLKDALSVLAVDTSVACMGCSPNMEHVEPGLAVMMDQTAAMEVARTFGQLAVYWYNAECFSIVPLQPNAAAVPLPLI